MKGLRLLILTLFTLGITQMLHAQKQFPTVSSIKALDGKPVKTMDIFSQNKLTVVSLWATWCSPCKKELDAMKALYNEWKELGIDVLAVSEDNAQLLGRVKPMVKQKKWPYQIISDANGDLKQALSVQAIPHTFIVNNEGHILFSHTGYNPGYEYELDEKLRSLLSE